MAPETRTSTKIRTLVTGAEGFVGGTLCRHLQAAGYLVRATTRRAQALPQQSTAEFEPVVGIAQVDGSTDWRVALNEIDVVVHLAAKVHVMRRTAESPAEYRRVNVEGTVKLARDAAVHGVKRMVFLSSAKVNGEQTLDQPYSERDIPRPEDAYSISKWEAEQALDRIAQETALEIAILRAPLVYGPCVKGNFLRLMRLVARGVPLPFASLNTRRSLVYVGNLADALITCLEAPAAAGKTYLVSDGEDVSTPALIRALAAALDVPARLFPCPVALLRIGAAAVGRGEEMSRLIHSLQIDSGRIRSELGWRPRYSLTEGLRETAQWFKDIYMAQTR